MSTVKKRISEVRAVIERLGYTVDGIKTAPGGHLQCLVRDDQGNRLKAYTGVSTCSASGLLNFKQDLRRLSNKAKGLIDE